jgi:hypothetical protein
MNDKELNKLRKQIKDQIKLAKSNDKEALRILFESGIYTKTGKLKKLYR